MKPFAIRACRDVVDRSAAGVAPRWPVAVMALFVRACPGMHSPTSPH